MTLSEALKKIRGSTKLSARKFALLVGVDMSRLKKWEAHKGNPKVEDAQTICRFLGIETTAAISEEELSEIIERVRSKKVLLSKKVQSEVIDGQHLIDPITKAKKKPGLTNKTVTDILNNPDQDHAYQVIIAELKQVIVEKNKTIVYLRSKIKNMKTIINNQGNVKGRKV